MKNDLISRSALIKELEGFKVFLADIVLGWVMDRIIERVKEQPAVDAVAVLHGQWEEIEDFDGERHWRCSACGLEWFFYEGGPRENGCAFCPSCGAQMEVPVNE